MRSEVAAFIRQGVDPDQACHLVGFPRSHYFPGINGRITVRYLPTPSEIEATTSAIRSGELDVSTGSRVRWRELADLQEFNEQFDLAGGLPEDSIELPPFLYSAGRDA